MFNRYHYIIRNHFDKIQKIFKLNKKEYKKIEFQIKTNEWKKMNALFVGKKTR